MKETPRDLALQALIRLTRDPSFSSAVLDRLFRANRNLDDRDRAFVSQLVQGVVRWRLRLDWTIGEASRFALRKIDPPVLDILRLALYQIFFLDRVPESAAVNEAVKQAKATYPRHIVSFVNGLLRNICRQKDRIAFPDRRRNPIRYLSLFHSYPEWLVEKWIRELGEEETEALLEAGNRTPLLGVRANGLKISRSELIPRLEREGLKARRTPYSPLGVVVEGLRGRVDQLTAFKEGLFQVQDEAAQVTSFLLAAPRGSTVLDVCAGYGGKTSHLAELMINQGKVVALDINRARLISLAENSRRLGLGIIHYVVADASKDISSLLRSSFDRIMVDAPCSGLGVISRHPDAKWNRDKEDIKRLAELQLSILTQAAEALGKGGKMLYVTCTLSREENEGVVEAFLTRNRSFALEDLRDRAPHWALDLIDERGFLRTMPHIHRTNGFFAALFKRIHR
jgi:16S rRNA (cytosine967-C5)-methyltransferase